MKETLIGYISNLSETYGKGEEIVNDLIGRMK